MSEKTSLAGVETRILARADRAGVQGEASCLMYGNLRVG